MNTTQSGTRFRKLCRTVVLVYASAAPERNASDETVVDWVRVIPFIGIHLTCLPFTLDGVGTLVGIVAILKHAYGSSAQQWYHRWRIFFLSCEELFGFKDGTEWMVTHYRFTRA